MVDSAWIERRIVSVLFADVVGFTSLAERLDAEDVAAIQDAYFALVRETIARHDGQLEKFIGDAAMAVFGIPRTREDDAVRAVRAALALTAGVEAVGARLGLETGGLQIRVGVNTGDVVHAGAGPDEGRVTGDTVNVAARLQSAAPPGGVLIGEQTALAVAEAIELGPSTPIELKGKAEPVRAAIVLGVRPQRSREKALGTLRASLVGRDPELAWFREAVAGVPLGGAKALLVVAPPGVGKSRFVSEAVDGALRTGLLDVAWSARVVHGGGAYDPLAELARAALGPGNRAGGSSLADQFLASAAFSEARARVIAEAFAELIATTSPARDTHESGEDGALQAEAWLDGLDALAGSRSLAWVIEDLHWASSDLIAILERSVRRASPPGGRRIILATARPSLLEHGSATFDADRLDLAQLGPQATAALIRALVGDVLPSGLVESIADRSDGNPLFIEELLRSWVAVGALEPNVASTEPAWRLNVPAARLAIPSTVQAIYAAQIDDLPGGGRAVVRRGSVAGREFPSGALPALGVPGAQPALSALVAGQVLSGPRSDPLGGDHYAYRHALLRDAGYASLARAERARLHILLARWLEAAAGDRVDEAAEVIGGHYAAALEAAPMLTAQVGDELDRSAAARLAAAWLERGGRRARQLGAIAAARVLFERAVLLTPLDEHLTRAGRLVSLGDATAAAADMDEAARRLEEGVGLYRSVLANLPEAVTQQAARTGMAEAIERLGRVWFEQLHFVEARELATAALSEIGPAPDHEPDLARARLLLLGAKAEHAATDSDTSEALNEVVGIARKAGDRRLELDALVVLAVVRQELGLPDPESFEAVDRLARELGEWSTIVSSLVNRSLELADDHGPDALVLLDEAEAIAEARGMVEQMAWLHYVRAEALAVIGDLDAAREECEQALALANRNAYRRVAVRTYHLLLAIAAARGDPEPAARLKRFWAEHSGPLPDSPYARIVRAAMDIRVAAAEGEPIAVPEVEPRLHSLETPHASASWLLSVEEVVTTWIRMGEVAGARDALRRMEAVSGHPETSELGRGTIDLLAARLAWAAGEPSQAEQRARSALRRFASIPAPWWEAKALRTLDLAGAISEGELRQLIRISDRLALRSI